MRSSDSTKCCSMKASRLLWHPEYVVPKSSRALWIGHLSFQVLVSSLDVRAAAASCLGRLIVAHVWLDSGSDYVCECSAEQPA